ncbi:MAG: phage tail protein [Planctomycetes bacterium]|nr:phage tail protein [Planctomycetota bacterium]
MNLDLLRGDCFHLEIDGISAAGFASCRGLGGGRDLLEYPEGGFDGVRVFAGAQRAGSLLLERGLCRDRSLWEWFEQGDPRAGAVVLLDARGRETARWSFDCGWPRRWEGPELNADAQRVALERLEIVHEGLRWRESPAS